RDPPSWAPADPEELQHRGGDDAAWRERVRPQRLQDRAGETRHRSCSRPSRRTRDVQMIGTQINRVAGAAKVTGDATYAAGHSITRLAQGGVVSSHIARGKILRLDATEALALPGVLRVFTHENVPKLAPAPRGEIEDVAPEGVSFRPLRSARVLYSGQ